MKYIYVPLFVFDLSSVLLDIYYGFGTTRGDISQLTLQTVQANSNVLKKCYRAKALILFGEINLQMNFFFFLGAVSAHYVRTLSI